MENEIKGMFEDIFSNYEMYGCKRRHLENDRYELSFNE